MWVFIKNCEWCKKIEKIVIVPCRLTIVQLLGWNKFSFADINWKFERE